MRADEPRTELEEERDFLLRSLDDLEGEHAGGDLTEDDYRALKEDYTARAAAVLRRLQRLDASDASDDVDGVDDRDAPAARDAASSPRRAAAAAGSSAGRHGSSGRRRPRWPMALGIAATLALAGGSGYLVTQTAGERRPGQEATGTIDTTPRSLLRQAIDLDEDGRLVDAAKLYDAVLAEEPENVVALTRRGWVLGRSGRQAESVELLQAALGYLDRATAIDPSYADAHAFRGLVLGALRRPGEAVCEFRLWLAIAPIPDPQRPAVEGVLDEAIRQSGGELPECPRPPVPVPAPPPPPQQQPAP